MVHLEARMHQLLDACILRIQHSNALTRQQSYSLTAEVAILGHGQVHCKRHTKYRCNVFSFD